MQGIVGVFEIFQTDRRGHGFTGMACKIFDKGKLVLCKNSLRECMKISWNCTKQEWYHLLTSIVDKNQKPIITRIKRNSNLLIFEVMNI